MIFRQLTRKVKIWKILKSIPLFGEYTIEPSRSTSALSFRFSGKIARLLGRESVSSEIVALFELVKNSYDADASKVELSFQNVTKPGGIIKIKDDGTGMTFSDFRDKWMVVGTESKERSPVTKKGRRVVGEKGIGRFSTEKLAKHVTLLSNPYGSEDRIIVKVNWEDYEKEGALFDQVKNPVIIESKKNVSDHGLEITLENLRDKWTVNMIQQLKKEIGTLVLPTDLADSKQDFNVILNAPEFKISHKAIESSILQMAPYRMTATIAKDRLHCIIYERKKRYERDPHIPNRTPECGPITFQLFVFPQDAPTEYGWTKYYENNLAGIEIDEFLKEHSGIRIYRDGFWVKPYGAPGNDWLELDKMRVSRYTNVGNSQVIGFVKISRDRNPEIRDTTTRERLIENDAFRDMKEIVLQAIKEFNHFRKELKREKKEIEARTPSEELALNNLDHVSKMVEKTPLLPPIEKKEIVRKLGAAKSNFKEYITSKSEEVTEKETALISQKSLVTLGLATSYIAHEVIRPLDDNIKILNRLAAIPSNDSTDLSKKLKADIEQLKFNTTKLLHFMSFVNDYVSMISNSIDYKWQSSDVRISDLWNRVTSAFKEVIDQLSISVTYQEMPDKISIFINAIDLESILINLLTNSIRAVQRISGQRMIKVEASFQQDNFVLRFSDNGPGISAENRERIFEPLFSTYTKKDLKTHGTGLGLPIVREVLQRYAGTIELVQNGTYQQGATFLVQIPLSRAPRVV